MRTPKTFYKTTPNVYTCELPSCPRCEAPLVECSYLSGSKVVQTLTEPLRIAYRPKRCADPGCPWHQVSLPSAQWQQIAPWYGTYGYDVIARIGWQRQKCFARFGDIHQLLEAQLQISESHVRYLYHQQYMPLLACVERQQMERLQQVGEESGLILGLDGLAPEGGEPQLWLVRELQTRLPLRCGWLATQEQVTFENFLQPIRDLGLSVVAVMSDKQRGLVPAIAKIFPDAKYAFCQMHYLKNMAEPVSEADEKMKVTLRKQVRQDVGELIRHEHSPEAPGVLTVTGLLPSPVAMCQGEQPTEASPPAAEPRPPDATAAACEAAEAHEAIVEDILRRVRYLLTLKGRPPFRLAGLEMVERLSEVATCIDALLAHHSDARLEQLCHGLWQALEAVRSDYSDIRQAAHWLHAISELLDPEGKPARSGEAVRKELWEYLESLIEESRQTPSLQPFCDAIRKVTSNYNPGLFHCYDVADLPRTNNTQESTFRDLTRRLLSTTGQKGWTRRLLHREGAWELMTTPQTLEETVAAVASVEASELAQEQQRVRHHRRRFRLHIRSAKQGTAQLEQLKQQWFALPTNSGP